MTTPPQIPELNAPPPLDPVQNAIENAELMIEESVRDSVAIEAGQSPAKPSYRGEEYDAGYAQGRKDACRVILISLGVKELGLTTDKVRREHSE